MCWRNPGVQPLLAGVEGGFLGSDQAAAVVGGKKTLPLRRNSPQNPTPDVTNGVVKPT